MFQFRWCAALSKTGREIQHVSKICNCTIPFYPWTCNQVLPSFPLQPLQSVSKRPYPTSPCPKSHPCGTMTFTTPVFHSPRSLPGALHPPPACCLLSTSSVCRNCSTRQALWLVHPMLDGCGIFDLFRSVDHIWLQFVLQTDPGIQAQLPTTSQKCEKSHFPKGCTNILPALALCQCRTPPLPAWMKWRVKRRLKKGSGWTPQVSILSVTRLS